MEKRLIPEVRFKGFVGDWEEKKLSEIDNIEIYQPKTITANDFINDGKYKVFGANGYIGFYDKYNHNTDQVTISCRGENSGLVNYVEAFTWITGNSMVVNIDKCKGLDKYFLYNLLSCKNLKRIVTGSGQPQITRKDLVTFKIEVPSLPEQEKIGRLFENLDQTIDLQGKVLEENKRLKQALLQKLFPKKGQKLPELRLKGFSGDWEDVAIGDIFKVTRGNVLAKDFIRDEKDDEYRYPVYSSQTLNNGLLGYYNDYLYENAITWTTDGANAGTVNYREGKFYSTNVNGVLLSKEGYANRMIAERLNGIAYRYVSRVGNPKLMNNVMSKIVIGIPSLPEQEAIGNLFRSLDEKIAREEERLEGYKTLKKSLLQKMFV